MMIHEWLVGIFDRVTMEVFGHSYRFRRYQRQQAAKQIAKDQLKARLVASVVTRLRADLNAPDDAGW